MHDSYREAPLSSPKKHWMEEREVSIRVIKLLFFPIWMLFYIPVFRIGMIIHGYVFHNDFHYWFYYSWSGKRFIKFQLKTKHPVELFFDRKARSYWDMLDYKSRFQENKVVYNSDKNYPKFLE